MKSRVLFVTAMNLFAALLLQVRLAAQEQQKSYITHQSQYRIKDLGTLPGNSYSVGYGINDKGQVTGLSCDADFSKCRAFLWRHGVMIDLGTLGGPNSEAGWHPSDRGQVGVAGETSTRDPLGEDFCGFGTNLVCLPFVWQKGEKTVLPTLGGNNGRANGFNNWGQVVGRVENTTPDPTCEAPQVLQSLPVIWKDGQIEEQLPTIPGDSRGGAVAINDRGQAVGFSGNCTTPLHAVLWEDGTAMDLGNLGSEIGNVATAINNRGQVVGYSDLPDDTATHAFLWQNGVMGDLGALPGDSFSFGDGINRQGHVVGASCDIDFNCRAFLWRHGVMIDLNTLISPNSPLFLIEASGTINSRGQIAGYALEISTDEIHAFLATPREKEAGTESAALAAQGTIREASKVIVPESVRKLLRARLARRVPLHPGLWPQM